MELQLCNADIEKHSGMIHRLASKYLKKVKDPAISYDDLVAEAQLALLQAYKRFDPDKGFAFSTFAFKTVAGYIQRFIDTKGSRIRFPAHAVTLAHRIYREGLEEEAPETIALKLGKSCGNVLTALEYFHSGNEFELDRPVGGINTSFDSEPVSQNLVKTDDDISFVWVEEFLNLLNPLDRQVADLMMKGYNTRQIGRVYGVTHQAIWNRMRRVKEELALYEQGQLSKRKAWRAFKMKQLPMNMNVEADAQ